MKDRRIEEIWNEIEDTDPDISTERLASGELSLSDFDDTLTPEAERRQR